jgi:hypothetical protein
MKNKEQIILEKKILNEDWIENTLMIAGFVPILGEIADIALIIYYLTVKKEPLYAVIMLIALIPTVGDFIAKPFIKLLKGSKVVLKNSDDLVKFLNTNPKAKKMYGDLAKHLDNPTLTKAINQTEEIPKIGKTVANALREGVNKHKGIFAKVFEKPLGVTNAIKKEFGANAKRPISAGIKNYFKTQRLSKYVASKGYAPKNWLSNWYNVVYKARGDRRKYIKSFIVANNLLDYFNLPSIESFWDKFEKDENFRDELAQNEKFSDMVKNSTDEQDLANIEGNQQGGSNESGEDGGNDGLGTMMMGGMGTKMGIELLKRLAQFT